MTCGVYFLYQDCDLVYIGKSRNIEQRIKNHSLKGKFNKSDFIEYPEYRISEIEKNLISKHKPILNNRSSITKEKPECIVIRVDKALKDKLEVEAAKADRTLSNYVRKILTDRKSKK